MQINERNDLLLLVILFIFGLCPWVAIALLLTVNIALEIEEIENNAE